MKKTFCLLLTLLLFLSVSFQEATAQSFIKKLKNKAEDAAVDEIFKDKNKTQGSTTDDNTYNTEDQTGNGNNSPSNTKGGGLTKEEVNVNKSITDAETAFDDKEFTKSRNAVRLAIQGIELEIGENILKDLPASINGLDIVSEEDKVTSTGIGFVGLIIQRVYRGDDQEFRVTIGNDAMMLAGANMYMASGAYATSSDDQNYKQTTLNDQQAVIEYDESSGYKLSVPLGQSTILLTEGVNFNTEEEFMKASEEINIDNIKKQMGEQ